MKLQAGAPEAAGESSEPPQESRQLQNVGSEVGWASVWAVGACLTQGGVLGEGDVGEVTHWVASVAGGPFVGGAEDQGSYEAVKLEASVGAGWGECAGP